MSRDEAHRLIDQVPDRAMPAIEQLLRSVMDPVELAIFLAPDDDEPETQEERQAVLAALIDPSPDIPFEQVSRTV